VSVLSSLHEGARLVVLVGPGGVGKTTLAAALAIDAADAGRRVALLTIDPARRLAGALGLERLDDALAPVPGVPRLEAAMLDTKASFDALIGRIASSDADRRRILDNRVYEAFSRTLARPHAYVAMERLFALVTAGEHDLVVLDTPPTRSALDILDAPGRLARFVGGSVAETLVAPLSERGASAWLRRRGSAAVSSVLGGVLGAELLADLSSFFEVFFHLRHGFAERASAVQEILRAADTAFVLASAPDEAHLWDAGALAESLAERGVVLRGALSNRVFYPGDTSSSPSPEPPWLSPEEARLLEAARMYRAWLVREAARRERVARSFVAELPDRPLHLVFPALSDPPLDVGAVRALAGLAREFAREPVSS